MFTNDLTPQEEERLAILLGNCGKTVHIISKILRHGYESCNPNEKTGETNREMLEKSLGGVLHAMSLLTCNGDADADCIEEKADEKDISIEEYLHHQTGIRYREEKE